MADRDEEQILYDTIAEGSSQYWNEEEGNEDPNQYLNEEGNVERDAEGNQQGHVERDVEGNQEEEASGSQPSVGQKRARGQRGAAKKLEGRHIITEVQEDGRPSAPAEAAKNYVRHSGWVVRDNVPVSTVYWRRTRARGDHESFVPDSPFLEDHNARDIHPSCGYRGQSEKVDSEENGRIVSELQGRSVPEVYTEGADTELRHIPKAKGSLGRVRCI
ncbi:Os09g0564933 [Oryza sativa Japonica Group]|uniref:Os09g0564933 protein n=1 Tax=Oryza sativa subsp. japonica TaxID=39947 RepID=A0A0P0XQH2_ORYSJ|nr:Os09g0564933 [Oryza sativa Japonica Group]